MTNPSFILSAYGQKLIYPYKEIYFLLHCSLYIKTCPAKYYLVLESSLNLHTYTYYQNKNCF